MSVLKDTTIVLQNQDNHKGEIFGPYVTKTPVPDGNCLNVPPLLATSTFLGRTGMNQNITTVGVPETSEVKHGRKFVFWSR